MSCKKNSIQVCGGVVLQGRRWIRLTSLKAEYKREDGITLVVVGEACDGRWHCRALGVRI